ncbi:hypothetical protein DCC81_10215 [Chitinophaga parva]|uniref:Peptidase M4 n=1 Tax=Chitinophaga parva TaxID=2169414 RepID=A0A2T7BEL2_9BACT|nr:M4 family metallopeptidase [Chitinophaga parva]PUZ24714.1 hypothetical protein DCC81_10215 [Chitinophaga parva]
MKYIFTCITVLFFLHARLYAQHTFLDSDTAANGKYRNMILDVKQHPVPAARSAEFLRSALKLQGHDSLRLKTVLESSGRTHQVYEQYYKGFRVPTGGYSVHIHDGVIETANGTIQDVGDPSLQVMVDESTALKLALAAVPAKVYGWQDEATMKSYREAVRDPQASLYPKGELILFRDDSILHAFRLAYQFHVYAALPLQDYNVFIDAQTGRVLAKRNLICFTNTAASGQSLYSGYVYFTSDSYGTGQYRLMESRSTNSRTATIHTYNNASGSGAEFSQTSTTWPTDAGLDVHWGTEKVFDYWASVRSRNSYDNAGSTLNGYVHTSLTALGYPDNDNAFWNPTVHAMYYGDGTTQFKAVVALDVIAHEIGHGVTQYTAGLNSSSEDAALNEGLSDIWASVIEYNSGTYKQYWTIGEEIMKNGQPYLRSLQNPKANSYPEYYHGTYWDYSNEPHKNSTVFSHWFYLLANGGNANNEAGNHYNVTGQGVNGAADIVWAAQTGYMSTVTSYADMRNATINAATALYGAQSCQVRDVTYAWYAVGVGTAPPDANMLISGANAFCSTAAYTISGVPAGQTVTWSLNTTSYASLAASGNAVTLTKTAQGPMVLTASLPYCITASKSVSTQPLMNLSSAMNGSCNGSYQDWLISASPNMPLSNYVWTAQPSGTNSSINIYNPSGSSSYVSVRGGGGITITAKDACNENVQDGVTVYAPCPQSFAFSLSPNPAVSTVNIQPRSSTDVMAEKLAVTPQITQVNVYDQMGNRVRQQKVAGTSTVQINVSGLRLGYYTVEIEYNNKQKERQQIIVGSGQ